MFSDWSEMSSLLKVVASAKKLKQEHALCPKFRQILQVFFVLNIVILTQWLYKSRSCLPHDLNVNKMG